MEWIKMRTSVADWLTRKLHLNVRFYGRSFALLSLAQTSGVLRGIATTFLMARWLNPVVLGEFRYVLALFGLAGIFAMSGMSAAVIRGVAQGDTSVARAAARRILRIAPIGSLALLVGAAERMWWGHEPAVAGALVVAAIAFTPYSASGLYGSILTGQEKIKELTRIAILNNLLYAVAFVTVLRLNRSLIAITLAYFGFDILFRGFLTIRELAKLPLDGRADGHLTLGNHLSGIGVFQVIAAQLDQILIQRFAGYQMLAAYSVAAVIPEQIKDMVNGLSGTFLQRLSRHEATEGHVRATRHHYWLMFGGSAVIVAAYAACAPFGLPLLFPQYGSATVLPSLAYALGLLAMPAAVGLNYFQARNDLPRLWRFYLTNSALQIITNLALIPSFGAWGAVWSKTATRLAGLPLAFPARNTVPDRHGDSVGIAKET